MQLGRWQVDREQRILVDGSERRSLTPRSWDLFAYLCDHPGELVRTETLLSLFWHGSSHDQAYVRKSIVEIRRALDDDARSPRYIKTVPKQGYVFVAPESAGTVSPPPPTLAVLPFVNIGGAPTDEAFADGLTEEVLNCLARRIAVPVVARTSSFQFKHVNMDIRDIGRSLDASHVLEGSIRRAGDLIRVTGQLIDASSGAHVWSQTYERVIDDEFKAQDDIADAVASAVCHSLGARQAEAAPGIRTVYVSRRFTGPDDFSNIVAAITRDLPPD